ncbi:MAG: MFS transporter [Bacteroidales bacterium]
MAEPVKEATGEVAAAMPATGLRRVAAAFGYRDFRVLWIGACTSSIGTWMQSVAENWLVLNLTGSAFFLGLDAFLQQLPIMLFTLIGGVVADRRDRRRMLLASQYVQMTTAFALALLVFTGVVQIWHILTLSFITGLAQAFGGPAYQSLIPSLVEKKDLPNAIALNSIQFNLARVIGPLLAGASLAAFGMVSCFTLNGLSFLAVIVSLLSLRVRHIPVVTTERVVTQLRGGLSYVWHERALFSLTVLAFATTFLGTPLLTLLPVVVQKVFHQDVGAYSRMMAFSGAGAVCGALVVAWLGRFRRMGTIALLVQILFGLLIAAFALSRTLWLSDLLLFVSGACLMVVFSTITSLVQLTAPNEMRGRVMSIFMLAFRGGMPLGALVAGYLAGAWSAPTTLVIEGALLAIVAVYFLARYRTVGEI